MTDTLKVIDCTAEKPAQPEFEPIGTDDIETSEEARTYLDDAEAAVHVLLKIRAKAAELDNLVSEVFKKSWNDPMKHFKSCRIPVDEVLTEHSDILDKSDEFLKEVDVTLAKFKKLAEDCEGLVDDLEQQEEDDRRYGTYEEQVRSDYYRSVL